MDFAYVYKSSEKNEKIHEKISVISGDLTCKDSKD